MGEGQGVSVGRGDGWASGATRGWWGLGCAGCLIPLGDSTHLLLGEVTALGEWPVGPDDRWAAFLPLLGSHLTCVLPLEPCCPAVATALACVAGHALVSRWSHQGF